jgi:hypothetical protein
MKQLQLIAIKVEPITVEEPVLETLLALMGQAILSVINQETTEKGRNHDDQAS